MFDTRKVGEVSLLLLYTGLKPWRTSSNSSELLIVLCRTAGCDAKTHPHHIPTRATTQGSLVMCAPVVVGARRSLQHLLIFGSSRMPSLSSPSSLEAVA